MVDKPSYDLPYREQLCAVDAALREGDAEDAARRLLVLSNSHPGDAEVIRQTAVWCDLRGLHDDALACASHALTYRPRDPVYLNTSAMVLANAGYSDKALETLRLACRIDPGMSVTWYNLGIVLKRYTRSKEAVDALERALSLAPMDVAIRVQLATTFRDYGKAGKAEQIYRDILKSNPHSGVAWQGLSDLKVIDFTSEDVSVMYDAISHQIGTNDRVLIYFALAKAMDDVGNYEESLSSLASAKEILMQRAIWNGKRFSEMVSHVLDVFDGPVAGSYPRGSEVIFIVGMPRSGTTLVEQILCSHRDVSGGGELHDLKAVMLEGASKYRSSFPDLFVNAQPEYLQWMGERYLSRTSHCLRGKSKFTDKFTGNWLFTGAILAMLPEAHIVCCRRDPVETCFSCYRQYRDQPEYTNSFGDLARMWMDYDRSVKYWKAKYPVNVYELSYEHLVSRPADSISELIKFCGLPMDNSCLRFFDSGRPVYSPSAMQVRQPIRSDTARAPKYGKLLNPLRVALGIEPV